MLSIWNVLKAVRAFKPFERKKRRLLMLSLNRLKTINGWFTEVGKHWQNCFEWESKLLSFLGLLVWLAFCYYCEMWMIPFVFIIVFVGTLLIFRLTGNYPLTPDGDEDKADKKKKTLKERLQTIKEVTRTVKNAIKYVISLKESIKNLTKFTEPYPRYLAISMLVGTMEVLNVIPLRYLLMAWGTSKFTRKHVT